MPTKIKAKDRTTTTPLVLGQNNGAKGFPTGATKAASNSKADDRLAKANKAMQRAWQLISQRQGEQE